MNKRILIIVLVTVMACVALFFYQKFRVAPPLKLEKLQLSMLNGESVSMDAFKGRKLFVNFFATWCGPCVGEMPLLQDAQRQMGEDMVFICISSEPIPLLQRFVERTGLQLLVLHSAQPLKMLNIHTLPTSYILTTRHSVAYSATGVHEWNGNSIIAEMKSYD